MEKEQITKKQFITIIVSFLLGSALVLGTGAGAERDSWLAVCLGMACAIPFVSIYARIVSLFPGYGLCEILEILFGKIGGKILALPFVWYGFHLGALVIRNFYEFIGIVTLPETPKFITAFFMIVLSIWAAKAGIETIGRWTAIILPVILVSIFLVTILFIPILDPNNIKPVMENGVKPLIQPGFSAFSFPFAETVLFMALFGGLKKGNKPYKIYIWSLLIGGSILVLTTVRSILALGNANNSILYFSTYSSARLINIGNFLQRIEISVVFVFMLSGFTKATICLLVVCKGVSKALNIGSYREIVAPIGLLMMMLSIIIYRNVNEMFEWADKIYPYYAIPFQIILPLIIWIAAEMKARARSRKIRV